MGLEHRFSSAEIGFVIHATENSERILDSIESTLSVPKTNFSLSEAEGHFKNQIRLASCNLASGDANEFATRVISLLRSSDKEELSRNLSQHSDERGNLYIRIDKQALCKGRVILSESDSIRIRFKPVRRFKPSGNLESYRGLLSSTIE
ncbi:MAG: RNA-binding domain-containing protein [Nitrososphaera sp.]